MGVITDIREKNANSEADTGSNAGVVPDSDIQVINVNYIGVNDMGYHLYREVDTGVVWEDVSKSLPCTNKVKLQNTKTGAKFEGKPNFVF